jgi:hypothetical protein
VNQEKDKDEVDKEDKDEDKDEEDKDSDDEMTLKKPSIDVKVAAPVPAPAPFKPLELSDPSESCMPLEPITLESKESTLHGVLKNTVNKVLNAIETPSVSSPPIIMLDKPSVSFAKFNSLFSSEDPEQSNMINANEDESPDLEILDETGTSLSGTDFDSLDDAADASGVVDDYEEL